MGAAEDMGLQRKIISLFVSYDFYGERKYFRKASKMVYKEKSEENAIKMVDITENIDIYSLFEQKMINFACVLL